MKKIILSFLFCINVYSVSPGDKAINFKLLSDTGKEVELSKFKKPVIIEWYNDGCPFVRKHYDSGNMQKTQDFFKEQTGGTWVTIISSTKGNQGHLASAGAAKIKLKEESSRADYLLLDLDGKVGQLYGAVTTPQMVLIGSDDTVKYYGAIDSIPSASKADLKNAVNYVIEATKSLKAQEKVKVSKTRPYGCSVKY